MNAIENAQSVSLGEDYASLASFPDLKPRRLGLPIATIKGHDFESLIMSISSHVIAVDKKPDGTLSVTLDKELSWDSGVVNAYRHDKAGVALVARAATMMASKLFISGGHFNEADSVLVRQLNFDASKFLTPNPWANDDNAELRMPDISINVALATKPDVFIREIARKKSKRIYVSLAALLASSTACALSAPEPPAIVSELPTGTPRPYVAPLPIEVPEAPVKRGHTFEELWSKYLNVQLSPAAVKGKVIDFNEYCIPYPRGCGFDAADENFEKEFHGNFVGYIAVQQSDGIWLYFEE